MARISVPTTARLPSSLRLSSDSRTVQKTLGRLSRASLLTLAIVWLEDGSEGLNFPHLRDDEDSDEDSSDFYPPAASIEELRDMYLELQSRKGSRREIVDRMLSGDWRDGVTLHQLAMLDLQYLYDHPLSQRWTAFQFIPLKLPSPDDAEGNETLKVDEKSFIFPRFHPSTFVQNLQKHVLPDVKAHYTFERPKDMPLWLLRLYVVDSPYATAKSASSTSEGAASGGLDPGTTIYIAFPDASPYIYLTKPQSSPAMALGDSKSFRSLLVEGIPQALSRPQERYALKATGLATRNMEELLHRRGSGKTNSSGGGWSVYSESTKKQSPLDQALPTPPLSDGEKNTQSALETTGLKDQINSGIKRPRLADQQEDRRRKRARLVAKARFGESARIDDGRGVERVDITIMDPYQESGSLSRLTQDPVTDQVEETAVTRRRPSGRRSTIVDMMASARTPADVDDHDDDDVGDERPHMKLVFHGSHVFAGIRQLVEAGVIDGERMPSWLTGEEGVTIGTVRHGRLVGYKGSGV